MRRGQRKGGKEGGGAGMRDASGDLGIYAHELGNSTEGGDDEEVGEAEISFVVRFRIAQKFPSDNADFRRTMQRPLPFHSRRPK